ncbi:hypothetical protein H8356DRAFT_1319905 [Neocallimastix lanati (nom. inval.)]|nr:hypothetical protein H8356DRAFT_1319905 [Neocallimastix sp. JGI-2020a]
MSKSFEENTKDFYDELNGECDPKRLLYIAEKGIFLKEPLFKYDKIKDNEYVVDISYLLEDFIKINENNIEDILRKILIESGKDINILNYCLDKVKRNNSKIKSIEGYRVPMHYCFETLKYYSDELCIKNHLYLKCEDKYAEEFINVLIDINKINTNENETNENETNENETNENEYINDIQGQLIKIIDPQYKGKLSYIESYELNPGDINF